MNNIEFETQYRNAKSVIDEAAECFDDAIEIFESCKTAEQVLKVGFAILENEFNLELKGCVGSYVKDVISEMCIECLNKPYSKHDNQGDIDDRCDSINENFKVMNDE